MTAAQKDHIVHQLNLIIYWSLKFGLAIARKVEPGYKRYEFIKKYSKTFTHTKMTNFKPVPSSYFKFIPIVWWNCGDNYEHF